MCTCFMSSCRNVATSPHRRKLNGTTVVRLACGFFSLLPSLLYLDVSIPFVSAFLFFLFSMCVCVSALLCQLWFIIVLIVPTAAETPRRARCRPIVGLAKQRRPAEFAANSATRQVLRIGRPRMETIKGKCFGNSPGVFFSFYYYDRQGFFF